ncbi:MAG: hypothetical protein ACRDYF_02055 [Acidimicrobiia bacterium]
MATPRSIRFDDSVVARLSSYVSRHPGLTASSVAARLVDEGLRMEEHPGIIFRDGPMGRRATLVGGPDVWEVIRALRSARATEPTLGEDEILELVADNSGVPLRLLRVALDYWASYPEEVDALVAHAAASDEAQRVASERSRGLLAG